jgi:scyllo-inositol 2-dehydrogenase (NADP+)
MRLRVGLVGFGLAGRVLHAPLIRTAGMEIVGVVTRQAEAVAASLPAASTYADAESLLAAAKPDLVVITSPNHLHHPQALLSLAAGAHVVVDKPMALTMAEAHTMMQAAASAGRVLSVFHNRRWDSDFLTVQRLVAERALSAIHHYEARWERFSPTVRERWRERAEAGGGLLNDLGPHLIDQALCLFGQPDWLQAEIYTQRPGAVVDDAFEIRMGRGPLRMVLGANCLAASPAPRFRLLAATNSYTKYGLDVQEAQLKDGMQPDSPGFGVEPESQRGLLTDGASAAVRVVPAERGNWLHYYQSLQRSITHGTPPPVAASAAPAVLSIIEAARRSSAAGCRVKLLNSRP